MERRLYKIDKIEGEYAYLQNVENSGEEPLFIAMALLPLGSDIGTLLCYENFEFTVAGA